MFEFITGPFNFILYYPLFNSLLFIYHILPWHDFGLAIIALTLVIRLILYPVSVKAFRSQRAMQKLQPQLKEVQIKYKDDKEKQAKETMELYRKEKINPFSGLLLALIQLPILIALYRVFWWGVKDAAFNPVFFSLVDLSKANIYFAAAAGIFQFFQTKMLMPKPEKNKSKGFDMASMMQTQMVYLFPFLTVIILLKLPSALGLYWIVSGAFSVAQQWLILKKHD